MLWPSNQNGELQFNSADFSLSLPIPTDHEPYTLFEPGDGALPRPKTTLEPSVFKRELVRDMPSGVAAYHISDAAPRVRFDDHKIETWNATTRIYRIDEDAPETASMQIQRDIEVGRDDWRTSTHVEALIKSDATTYYADITLTAKHNGKIVVQRSFPCEKPRYP